MRIPIGRVSHKEARPSAFTPPQRALTIADRCDAEASGAERAYVRVTWAGGELLFCAHHYAQHQTALAALNPTITDERAFVSKAD